MQYQAKSKKTKELIEVSWSLFPLKILKLDAACNVTPAGYQFGRIREHCKKICIEINPLVSMLIYSCRPFKWNFGTTDIVDGNLLQLLQYNQSSHRKSLESSQQRKHCPKPCRRLDSLHNPQDDDMQGALEHCQRSSCESALYLIQDA